MPSYFNVSECGRKLLNRIDVSYELVCMATPRDEYYTNMLETLVNYNDLNNGPLSNREIQQSVRRVMTEMEEEERDTKCNANHVTMDTISPCVHSTISPPQGDIASVTSERRISLINRCNELTIQSTINDSDDDAAEIDPNRNIKVVTYTTNGNSPQKLFNNRFTPKIIPAHPL